MAKQWTDAERKAFGEKMRAARAQKQKPEENVTQTQNQTVEPVAEALPEQTAEGEFEQPAAPAQQAMFTFEQVQQLLQAMQLTGGNQISKDTPPSFAGRPTINPQGGMSGTVKRYPTDKSYYPDPRDQLSQEPRLRRFSFDENYWLSWDVEPRSYPLANGSWVEEPFFAITCYMHQFNEQTGDLTGKSILMQTLRFTEDPGSAYTYASQNGLVQDESNMRELMNLARYERIKNWLFSLFYHQPAVDTNLGQETVIDGQVVRLVTNSEVEDYNPSASRSNYGV